ncbi:hypothetical protein N9Z27_02685, partial [Alphaproteobacteria bacterium]|nr:hypothetical protein [Alphaproteobacteria bacterium]
QYIDTVELSKQEWEKIKKPFRRKPKTAQQEREKIATAIGTFEQIIGAKTGSEEDIHGTFIQTGTYQLDCVDESVNTTMYIAALQNKDLIKFHDLHPPEGRVPIIHAGRWPHQAALIEEKDTEKSTENYYIVDSWFHDNGAPAEIIPLKQWKDGWKPENKE